MRRSLTLGMERGHHRQLSGNNFSGFSLAPVNREGCQCGWLVPVPGCQVLGLAVGVSAGVLGSCVSGRSHCRVAAFSLSDLPELANFFSTISHCAWRHVISWSLATKKRSKENAFKPATLSVHSVQFYSWVPQKHGARQSHGCVNPSFSVHGF